DAAEGASESARQLFDRFGDLLDDDFNTPGALGVLFDTAHEVNRLGGQGPEGAALRDVFRQMVGVLGIPLLPAEGEQKSAAAGPFIDLLVETRAALRAERQWALADGIRDRLKDLGVVIEDTPGGTTWHLE